MPPLCCQTLLETKRRPSCQESPVLSLRPKTLSFASPWKSSRLLSHPQLTLQGPGATLNSKSTSTSSLVWH